MSDPLSKHMYCDRCIDEPPVYRIVDKHGEYYLCRSCKNANKKLKKIKAK
jgi:hypothetical protein